MGINVGFNEVLVEVTSLLLLTLTFTSKQKASPLVYV